MESSRISKINVKLNTFDILSAGTDFYGFMSLDRLYYTFDKFVYDADRELFYQKAAEHSGEACMVRLCALDGSLRDACVKITVGGSDGQGEISLIWMDDIFDVQEQYDRDLEIKNRLLELYGDDSFVYSPDTESITVTIALETGNQILRFGLEEAGAAMKLSPSEHNRKELENLVANWKNGSRDYEVKMEGPMFGMNGDVKTSTIKGTAIYDGGIYKLSVGYIHQGLDNTASAKKIREHDSLTGLLSKGEITNIATRLIDVEKHEAVSIAIIDVDYFKNVNDTFGHLAGDRVLQSVASIIENEVGEDGVVGRFGGDEFFVIFYNAYDMENCRERLRSIKNIVNASFPENDENNPVITLSIGCAAYPKDAQNYEDVFTLADFALYRAKEKGRNRYIIYDEAKHGTLQDIKNSKHKNVRINSRGDMAMGDILCMIMDKIYCEENYSLDKVLDDYAENFGFQRIILYSGSPRHAVCMVGEKIPTQEILKETVAYLEEPEVSEGYIGNVLIVDAVSVFETRNERLYRLLEKQGVLSFIHVRFQDRSGRECILSLESVSTRITWNHNCMHNYRLMARALSAYNIE